MTDITDEEIEVVARAIYQTECDILGVEPHWCRGGFKTAIIQYQAQARAAILAYRAHLKSKGLKVLGRQPTEEMINTAWSFIGSNLRYEEVYRHLFDAAPEIE